FQYISWSIWHVVDGRNASSTPRTKCLHAWQNDPSSPSIFGPNVTQSIPPMVAPRVAFDCHFHASHDRRAGTSSLTNPAFYGQY
ncbi:unnamed protein product, partial [Mycena citricolor]